MPCEGEGVAPGKRWRGYNNIKGLSQPTCLAGLQRKNPVLSTPGTKDSMATSGGVEQVLQPLQVFRVKPTTQSVEQF